MPRKYIKTLIKNYLLSGKSITGLEALKRYGTMRLPVYIQRLRDDGYNIQKEMITEKGKTFARYFHSL